jgi:hypothetical protein
VAAATRIERARAGTKELRMSVELSQAELLRQWFTPIAEGAEVAEGADVADRLSRKEDVKRVGELLAELWFSGDYSWTQWSDADVLTVLQQWLQGSEDEAEFQQNAVPGQLADFIAWVDRTIPQWQAQEAEATTERGIENPDHGRDPISGTHYYRWAPDREEYLYSDDQDAPYEPGGTAWQSMDDRVATQDPTQSHYDPSTDRWRRPAEGTYEYQDRDDREWERTDGTSWLRKHNIAGWLPYDKGSDQWFHQSQWRAHGEVASASTGEGSGKESRVIPVHQIPGWEHLEGERWTRDWYALPSADGYTYLRSPGAVPAEGTPGWSDVPPAPTAEELEETAVLGFTLDEAAEAIDDLVEALSEWEREGAG